MIYKLRVSALAADDLNELYKFGFTQWGEPQADSYYSGMMDHIDDLCTNPFLYSAVDDIRVGYRRSVYKAHSVYYRIQDDAIEVIAVLGKQDVVSRI